VGASNKAVQRGAGLVFFEQPYSGSAAYFAFVYGNGNAGNNDASAVGGCAPAFCVA
jgi:hypothetical protein